MVVVCTRAAPAIVPGAGAGARAPGLEPANREAARVWKVGADEADLYLGCGPEAAADVSIWRAISTSLDVSREKRV